MKRLTAFCAITGLLLGEAAAEDRIERIDLTRFTCKQFLELNRDDALIVVGWLQGHYLDEHEAPVVDFTKLSVESVTLANRCVARPDENVIAARPRVRPSCGIENPPASAVADPSSISSSSSFVSILASSGSQRLQTNIPVRHRVCAAVRRPLSCQKQTSRRDLS